MGWDGMGWHGMGWDGLSRLQSDRPQSGGGSSGSGSPFNGIGTSARTATSMRSRSARTRWEAAWTGRCAAQPRRVSRSVTAAHAAAPRPSAGAPHPHRADGRGQRPHRPRGGGGLGVWVSQFGVGGCPNPLVPPPPPIGCRRVTLSWISVLNHTLPPPCPNRDQQVWPIECQPLSKDPKAT